MSSVTEIVTIPIEGMTCDHCTRSVGRALESVPGVQSATVDLAGHRAEVAIDPERVNLAELKKAVEGVGYTVPDGPTATPRPIGSPLVVIQAPAPPLKTEEEWNLAIGGMHCASCVARVEGALAGVPGVREASVNLATERASVVVDPARVNVDRLSEAVARAGYSAK